MFLFFVFKQKTAYEMRISDWSSDVCSSDLALAGTGAGLQHRHRLAAALGRHGGQLARRTLGKRQVGLVDHQHVGDLEDTGLDRLHVVAQPRRSAEPTSELPSLMRTSYAAFCLKKK